MDLASFVHSVQTQNVQLAFMSKKKKIVNTIQIHVNFKNRKDLISHICNRYDCFDQLIKNQIFVFVMCIFLINVAVHYNIIVLYLQNRGGFIFSSQLVCLSMCACVKLCSYRNYCFNYFDTKHTRINDIDQDQLSQTLNIKP